MRASPTRTSPEHAEFGQRVEVVGKLVETRVKLVFEVIGAVQIANVRKLALHAVLRNQHRPLDVSAGEGTILACAQSAIIGGEAI